jgi:molecular chaperone DnaK (HSP70)
MVASDKQEKERVDARNALEEYVYELRGKLSSEDELATFVNENERNSLFRQLDNMENWLYEEGEDCNRQIYVDKLNQLKVSTCGWCISLKCLQKIVSNGTTKKVHRNWKCILCCPS